MYMNAAVEHLRATGEAELPEEDLLSQASAELSHRTLCAARDHVSQKVAFLRIKISDASEKSLGVGGAVVAPKSLPNLRDEP